MLWQRNVNDGHKLGWGGWCGPRRRIFLGLEAGRVTWRRKSAARNTCGHAFCGHGYSSFLSLHKHSTARCTFYIILLFCYKKREEMLLEFLVDTTQLGIYPPFLFVSFFLSSNEKTVRVYPRKKISAIWTAADICGVFSFIFSTLLRALLSTRGNLPIHSNHFTPLLKFSEQTSKFIMRLNEIFNFDTML
jgi:hypothetical protein